MTFIEGLLTVLFGISELVSLDSDRLVMGADHGGVLPGLRRRCCSSVPAGCTPCAPWARGPVLLSQLILLGLAWSFKDG